MIGRRSAIRAIFAAAAAGPSVAKAAADAVANGPGEVWVGSDRLNVPPSWEGPEEQPLLERLHYRLQDKLDSMVHREENGRLFNGSIPARYHVPKSWSLAFRERACVQDYQAAERRREEASRALRRMGTKALIRAAKEAGIDVRQLVEDMQEPPAPVFGRPPSPTPF